MTRQKRAAPPETGRKIPPDRQRATEIVPGRVCRLPCSFAAFSSSKFFYPPRGRLPFYAKKLLLLLYAEPAAGGPGRLGAEKLPAGLHRAGGRRHPARGN